MEETWLIIVVALMFSALFSGIEIAFLSANRLQIELELKQKKWLAPVVDMFMGQGPRFIAALLVGNNIALVVYSSMLKNPYPMMMTMSPTAQVFGLSLT